MTDAERLAEIERIRRDREARGDADPFNRLRAYVAHAIASGEKPVTHKET